MLHAFRVALVRLLQDVAGPALVRARRVGLCLLHITIARTAHAIRCSVPTPIPVNITLPLEERPITAGPHRVLPVTLASSTLGVV